MPLDPSISLQTQAANPTNFISGFLDLGQKKINLDRSRATFDADVAQRQADSSTAQSAATVNAANVQPLIAQQAATTSTAQTGAQTAKNALTSQQAQIAFQQAGGLLQDPAVVAGSDPEAVARAVLGAKSRAVDQGLDPFKAEVMFGRLVTQAHDDPKGFKDVLANTIRGGTPSASQGANATPSGPMINNGQQFGAVNINPLAAGGVGSPIPGTSGQVQLPPTTTTIRNGQPGYVGPQPVARAGAPSVPSGPAIGEVSGTEGPIAANNAHFAKVQQDASGAADRVAALQNIKQQIPKAVMGGNLPGDTIRSVLSGLSGVFGFANSATTANDVMAKNLAQLAAGSGNTDAANRLGEMGSPNAHITPEAAQEAVAQIGGVEAKKQSANAFFANTPTNSPEYANKVTMWNRYADPRAFQYAALPKDEQEKAKVVMQKNGTWAALNNSMAHMNAMGVMP